MAHAVQVYQYHTTKSASNIADRLKEAKERSIDTVDCRVVRVEEERDVVMASIETRMNLDRLHYDVTIQPNNRCLIVQGRKDGRMKINNLLAKEIENKTRRDVISEHA